jgi:hypothetical protein
VANYRGISTFDTLDAARSMGQMTNERLAQNQSKPRWTHVAEFLVDGHIGQMTAHTPPEGHYLVWAEPFDLASSIVDIYPI